MRTIIKLASRYLVREKGKTISAFMGILLSSFLVTVVVVLGGSLIHTLNNDLVIRYGEWHIKLYEADVNEQKELIESIKIKEYSTKTRCGFVNETNNLETNYVCVYATSDNWADMMHQAILQGRKAISPGEIVVSKTLAEKYGDKYSVNCEGVLEVGYRYSEEGEELNEYTSTSDMEYFEIKKEIPYKVVGVYDDSLRNTEGLYEEIYLSSNEEIWDYTKIYAIMKNPNEVFEFGEQFDSDVCIYNLEYLSGLGISELDENTHDSIMFMCTIMLILIGVTAVLLICNSFQASFNERIKEFGLLVSLGESESQVQLVMLIEGIIIAIVAIPLGLILGISIVYASVSSIGPKLAEMIYVKIDFIMHIDFGAILIIIVISMLTVLVSILRPIKRAKKLSPISAIRHSYTTSVKLNIKFKEYKDSFCVEKIIAERNRKCYGKKYIASLTSISMSLIVLLSSITLTKYSMKMLNDSQISIPYDIVVNIHNMERYEYEQWYEKYIENNSKIDKCYGYGTCEILEIGSFSDEFCESGLLKEEFSYAECHIIDSKVYKNIIENLEIDSDNIDAIMGGYKKEYDVQGNDFQVSSSSIYSEDDNEKVKFTNFPKELNCACINIEKIIDKLPYVSESNGLILFISDENIEQYNIKDLSYNLFVCADDHRTVAEQLEKSSSEIYIHNVSEDYVTQKNSLFVIEFFMKIFIALIAMISMVNVYFTVMTNILMRKKEFMVLKSLGMCIRKICMLFINECYGYIKKIFIIGYGVSLCIAYLMHKGSKHATFLFPIKEAIIYGILIILLYLITYLIALKKVNRSLIIEEIKI